MSFRLVQELAGDGVPVTVACRVLAVSTSGFYEWRDRPASVRARSDAELTATIRDLHAASRGTYGVRRVHAELALGRQMSVGHCRVERLMRAAGLAGVHHRRWRHGPGGRLPAVFEDKVARRFTADVPDKLWVTDITQHRTGEGWVYCAAVLDVFSRRVVGWSIADHLRSELVVDALQMAIWRRQPAPGAIVHADRGSQGGFNRSSQHLVIMEVFDGSSAAGSGPGGASEAEVARASEVPARDRVGVLGPDRRWAVAGGGRQGCRCVAARRLSVVPRRWRDASVRSEAAHGPVSVVS
ncbi:IS3 family transposase [Cellulomonas sp. 73-92]|uniref:IS3 family transposase n=1 Tax=Cellulomonas sp. 73-92 TaxID=1895740 RepID=UPI000A413CAD|nr:IS3 family transposase [Cellulomonas sp. 73-92]